MDGIILDLGCGKNRTPGTVGIDISRDSDADIYHDLNDGIPFEDNSVDGIIARHWLEHANDFDFMMREIYRTLKLGTWVEIEVPYFTAPSAYFPLHKIPGLSWFAMMLYIEQCEYYSGIRFETTESRIVFMDSEDPKVKYFKWVEHLINRFPRFYDRWLSHIIPSSTLRFRLRKVV